MIKWKHCFITHISPSGCYSLQKRDAFCQLLQLMKTRHSQLTEPDVVSVFVGTWNMGKAKSDDDLRPCHSTDDPLVFWVRGRRLFCWCSVLFSLHRRFPSSSQPAVVGDLLWFGTHPWWVYGSPPTWRLRLRDSREPSGGEGVDRTYQGNPSQLHTHRFQTSNPPSFLFNSPGDSSI